MELDNKLKECRTEIIFAIKERIVEITKTIDTPLNLEGFLVMEKSDCGKRKDMIYIYNLYLNENDVLCCDYTNGKTKKDDSFIFERTLEYIYSEDLMRILNELYKVKWNVDVPMQQPLQKTSKLKTLLTSKWLLKGA